VDNQSPGLHLVLATFGFESLGLLWLGVMTGLLLRGPWRSALLSQPALHKVHQATAGLGLSLGVVHGIGQLERGLPFANSDDRIGTGLAVIGSEVLAAVALSVIIRRWLGPARWRALHLSSYAAFTLITAHVLISGTDVTPVWVWLPILGGWLVTVALWLTMRLLPSRLPPAPSPRGQLLGRVVARSRGRGDSPDTPVRVDRQLCTGLGLCQQLAPHVFRLDMDGQLWHRSTVSVDELELVARVAQACPMRAITLAGRRAITPAGRPALQSAPTPTSALRQGDISAVPGVRRRRAGSRGDH
jgi:ferredoxin